MNDGKKKKYLENPKRVRKQLELIKASNKIMVLRPETLTAVCLTFLKAGFYLCTTAVHSFCHFYWWHPFSWWFYASQNQEWYGGDWEESYDWGTL